MNYKVLSKIDNEWLEKYLVKNQSYFIKFISYKCELPNDILIKYNDILDLEFLCINNEIKWSKKTIEIYKNKCDWNWKNISKNTNVDFNENLIDEYIEFWDWDSLCENPAFIWSERLLIKYYNHVNWDIISLNNQINWSTNTLYLFSSKLNWKKISRNSSIPWTELLINEFINNWDWDTLSSNKSIQWSMELIEPNINRLNFDYLSQSNAIPWTIEFMDRFMDKLNWDFLSNNKSLPWSIELIEKFKNKWKWEGFVCDPLGDYSEKGLSANQHLPWSIDLIDRFIDKWNWMQLCRNSAIEWNSILVERYENKIYWGENTIVTRNKNGLFLCDNYAFVNRYLHGLSSNQSLLLTANFLKKYIERLNLFEISSNINIQLTIEIVNSLKNESERRKQLKTDTESIKFSSGGIPIDLYNSMPDIDEYNSVISINNQYEGTCDSLSWSFLSLHTIQSKDLITSMNEWNFWNLSINKSIPWSENLIEVYTNKWNWLELIQNESISWSFEFIKKYSDKWDSLYFNYIDYFLENKDWEYRNLFLDLFKKVQIGNVLKPFFTYDFISQILDRLLVLRNNI